jgi:hypothetical protein
MTGLTVPVRYRITGEIRRAASSCHGAKLSPGAEPGTFTCRDCGQSCGRVMSAPQEVTLTDG